MGTFDNITSRNASENPAGIETHIWFMLMIIQVRRNASENPAGIETAVLANRATKQGRNASENPAGIETRRDPSRRLST